MSWAVIKPGAGWWLRIERRLVGGFGTFAKRPWFAIKKLKLTKILHSSKYLSHSSSTMYSTSFKRSSFPWNVFKKDIGVVTNKLKPGCLFLSILFCSISVSFVMHLNDISVSGEDDNWEFNTESCPMIWLTSYWIGAMMIAVSFFDGDRFCITGNKYDKVFPVPVGAVTIMFRYYNRHGMTWVWTAVGLWNPNPSSP